jgi:hypothetical protein
VVTTAAVQATPAAVEEMNLGRCSLAESVHECAPRRELCLCSQMGCNLSSGRWLCGDCSSFMR